MEVGYDYFSAIRGKLYQIKHVFELLLEKPLNGSTERAVAI